MGRDVEKLKKNGKGKWKYMSEQEMIEISEKFKPYRYVFFPIFLHMSCIHNGKRKRNNGRLKADGLDRSVFMWYMWRVEDVDVSTLDGQNTMS